MSHQSKSLVIAAEFLHLCNFGDDITGLIIAEM